MPSRLPPPLRRGRPRGARNIKAILQQLAQEQHIVEKDGHRISMTTVDLLLQEVLQQQCGGNLKAMTWLEQFAARHAATPPDNAAPLIVQEIPTPEEWLAEQAERNRTATDPRLKDHDLFRSTAPVAPKMPSGGS